ncbi:MAG: hypothetical protein QME64_02880, partial [bacterium]|nr:hypothetical protein [bacterium]
MSDGTKIDIEQNEKTVIEIMLCSSTAMHCCLGDCDNGMEMTEGTYCMVETEKGIQLGRAISLPYKMKRNARCRQKQLVKIVRLATDADINKFE